MPNLFMLLGATAKIDTVADFLLQRGQCKHNKKYKDLFIQKVYILMHC